MRDSRSGLSPAGVQVATAFISFRPLPLMAMPTKSRMALSRKAARNLRDPSRLVLLFRRLAGS
jgi:hypothetical protein